MTKRIDIKYFKFEEDFKFTNGVKINGVEVAYTVSGKLNKDKSNAILICHAFSGDANVLSWWSNFVGKKKAFDTEKYFIICANVLGGCQGTTGPSSLNPKNDMPYGTDFPSLTIKDMVSLQKLLIEHLGIEKLYAVAGGSMGGMQALEWMCDFPFSMEKVIIIASCMRHSPMQIALNELAREAIIQDPAWYGGRYYGQSSPDSGMALARMLGHITFMSEKSMAKKFGRKKIESTHYFSPSFEVENYLHYNGEKFCYRFDANSYLYLTKAMDYFDVSEDIKKIKNKNLKVLVISFISDWLYPSGQSLDIVNACKKIKIDTEFYEIKSNYGHDAFLIKNETQSRYIKKFLKK